MLVASWPDELRPMVAKFGPQAVWETGLKVNGYPPTWELHGSARNRIEDELLKSLT